jgi:hypothetical protein
MASGLTPENRHSYRQFVYSLPHLLPCESCREHLTSNLSRYPPGDNYLTHNINALYWSWMLHDVVNRDLKKQRPSFDQIKDYYMKGVHNPQVWGPSMWRMIHSFAATYKAENAQAFKQFIYSLPGLIPCNNCKNRMLNVLQQLPLRESHLENNKNLFLWTYQLHDIINRQLGKVSPDYESVRRFYFNDKVCKDCKF